MRYVYDIMIYSYLMGVAQWIVLPLEQYSRHSSTLQYLFTRGGLVIQFGVFSRAVFIPVLRVLTSDRDVIEDSVLRGYDTSSLTFRRNLLPSLSSAKPRLIMKANVSSKRRKPLTQRGSVISQMTGILELSYLSESFNKFTDL